MTPNNHASGLDPDTLTAAQARRLQLWRATELSRAQADGKLTPEQTRLLESLADSLQALSAQLTQLAELGKQYAAALEALPLNPPAERPAEG